MKKLFLASLLGSTIALCTAAMAADDLKTLEAAAKAEGAVNSVGMPDDWANWKGTWADLASKYGLKHLDTDMSSAQEIAKFAAEKDNASADIGDVGAAFGPIAVQQGVTQPYKPSTWAQIPDWAKDQDGHWMLAYTGTIAFLINKDLVKAAPTSWQSLLGGDYKVTLGDVGVASQANNGVLAAAYATGGSEKNLKPALELFGQLGYTPAEVLKLATYDMAKYLGQDQSTGSIARGKLADFFLVPGDPTRDLREIKRIRAVVKDGAVYYPAEVYPHFGIKPFGTAPRVTLPDAP